MCAIYIDFLTNNFIFLFLYSSLLGLQTIPKYTAGEMTKVEFDNYDIGSIKLNEDLVLSNQFRIHSSLLPIFVPFYESDKHHTSPLEVEKTNHRKISFDQYIEQYIKSYDSENLLTGLSVPFYGVLFKFKYDPNDNNDLVLKEVIGDYNLKDDDKNLGVDTVSVDERDEFFNGLSNLKVCQ